MPLQPASLTAIILAFSLPMTQKLTRWTIRHMPVRDFCLNANQCFASIHVLVDPDVLVRVDRD